jgi:predicted DNA-binding transcriptional regulator AlpA
MSGDRRRNDAKASAMYERYQVGLSLAEVASAFGCSRQSVYEMFKSRRLQLRPRPARLPEVTYGGRTYTMRNTGYYGATSGDRHLLHRRMWEDANGPIPDQYDIHHLDEVKTHNELSNFECLPKAEHTRLYSPGCNQFAHKCKHSHGEETHDAEDRVAV